MANTSLPECLEVNKIDPDEADMENAVDENGEKVEASVVEPEPAEEAEDKAEEEKKEKIIYYVTDEPGSPPLWWS